MIFSMLFIIFTLTDPNLAESLKIWRKILKNLTPQNLWGLHFLALGSDVKFTVTVTVKYTVVALTVIGCVTITVTVTVTVIIPFAVIENVTFILSQKKIYIHFHFHCQCDFPTVTVII